MAVYRSPFSRVGIPSTTPTPPKEDYAARLAAEAMELNKDYDNAIARVQKQPDLSRDEKVKIIAEIDKMVKEGRRFGKPPKTGFVSGVTEAGKRALGTIIAPFSVFGGKKAQLGAYEMTFGTAQRAVQSGIKEIVDLRTSRGLSPFPTAAPFTPVARQTTPEEFVQRASGRIDPELKRQIDIYAGLAGETPKASVREFIQQTTDRDWFYRDTPTSKAINAHNPVTGFVTDMGVDIISEPATYVTGVGNVKYVGRLGKLSLAQRFSTKEMVTRYPQLAGKFNEIVRYGQHANIEGFKDILKAEGIQTGIRVLGKPVRGTEDAGEAIGRAISSSWEKVMDIATRIDLPFSISPKSRAFMQNVGRRTKGSYRVDETTALQNIAKWSALQFSRGRTPLELARGVSEIRDTIEQARQLNMDKSLTDLVETANPYTTSGRVRFDALPEEQQTIVRNYVDWQNKLRENVQAAYNQLAADYGLTVPELGWIDDYITHRMSPEAMNWIRRNKGMAERLGFKTTELSHSDITDQSQAFMYRKYRKPEVLPDGTVKTQQFFGEDVREGTIKELNDIFRRQTGESIDFFETDIGVIAESYAYSIAKMHGKGAFTRRMLEYGEDVARPLLRNMIPDPALRAEAAETVERVFTLRRELRATLNRRMGELRTVVSRGIRDAEAVIAGNLRQRRLNARQIESVRNRLDELEDALEVLRERAATLAADRRGEFDILHSELITNIRNLRSALDSGNAELNEILLGLQTTYQTMYPNAVRIPNDIDVLADRISAARGVPASREVRAINVRLREIRAQLDELDAGSPEYAELAAEIDRLKDLDNGYRVMSEYRAAQDYAPDNGFLYISGREMAETDEMQVPLKVLRTSTDGFPDKADIVGVRVFGNDEVLDFRTKSGVARTFGVNDFGDSLVEELRFLGVDAEPLETMLDAIRVGLPLDPQMESAFPELADLVKLMQGNQAREILPYGDPNLMKAIYDQYVDTMTGVLVKVGTPNADMVARQVVDGALGRVADIGVETNSYRGILLPANLFDDMAAADDIVVIMSPRVVMPVSDSVTAAVQGASSPLLSSIIRTDTETAVAAARRQLNELTARRDYIAETGTNLRVEQAKLNRRKGGLKGAATRRRNAAQLAKERAGEVKNAPREIEINGKVVKMNLQEIDKNMNALTATEVRLRRNMEKTLEREVAALRESGLTMRGAQAQLMKNTDRLRVLFNEANALYSWDIGTGMAIRAEVDAAIDALAAMPATGEAGDALRSWLAGLNRTVESSAIISDPAIRSAYERLTTLLAFDEFNLALADEAASVARIRLDAIDSGVFGGILDSAEKQVLDGWEAINGLGVQIPKELLDVWKPNLDQLFNKANRNSAIQALDWLNKIFKTYAIGTVGFVVRNLYSAVFMNSVAGVPPDLQAKAFKAMHHYRKFGPDKWLDELGLVGREREMYEQALMAVESTGRKGVFTELSAPVMRGGRIERYLANPALNNPFTRLIRGANTRVEDAVRFPLALKAIMDGDDYVGAASQVARYHFDYSDLSQVDQFFLQFIPFWIWMTRNLPNQIANQWMRPQVYSLYNNLKENLPADDTILTPEWQRSYEPLSLARFGLPSNMLIRPDLPHQRLEQTLGVLTSPSKMLGSAYPIYKLPVEAFAGKSLALDIPFSKKPQEAKGIDKVLAEALGALGMEKSAPLVRTAEGEYERQITEFPSYVLGNALPSIATLQRLAGGRLGGKASYADRQLSAISTFFGLPLDFVTERMQGSEAIGRQFALSDYQNMLQRLGYLEPRSVTRERERQMGKRTKLEEAARKAEEKERIEREAELLRGQREVAKKKYGTKSEEYKEIAEKLRDLTESPFEREKRLMLENTEALFGKESPQYKKLEADLKNKKSKAYIDLRNKVYPPKNPPKENE